MLQHLGGGLAPWNTNNYLYENKDGKIWVKEPQSTKVPVVFYHFHDFRYCTNESFRFTAEQYRLQKEVIALIYIPYVKSLLAAESSIRGIDAHAVVHENPISLQWIQISLARRIQFFVKGFYKNYFKNSKI